MSSSKQLAMTITESNRALLQKINNIRKLITNLRDQESNSPDEQFQPDGYESEEHDMIGGTNESERFSDLRICLKESEEINGIVSKNLTYNHVSSQGLPPGKWRAVETDLLIYGQLKVHIKFIENSSDENSAVSSLKWSVEDNLARSELASLASYYQSDLPGLLARFKEYVELAEDRLELLDNVTSQYGSYVKIKKLERGMSLTWQNLFQIMWSLKFCEYTEEIINSIHINVSEEDQEFIISSGDLVEELIKKQTTEERRDTILKLILKALQYEKMWN